MIGFPKVRVLRILESPPALPPCRLAALPPSRRCVLVYFTSVITCLAVVVWGCAGMGPLLTEEQWAFVVDYLDSDDYDDNEYGP